MNTTSWTLSRDIVEVDLKSIVPGGSISSDRVWHQLSASGKALIMLENVAAMSSGKVNSKYKFNSFRPVTGKKEKGFYNLKELGSNFCFFMQFMRKFMKNPPQMRMRSILKRVSYMI